MELYWRQLTPKNTVFLEATMYCDVIQARKMKLVWVFVNGVNVYIAINTSNTFVYLLAHDKVPN